ncbi:hypothetical protein, partial [Vibrio cholerae]|uniref:hypothetical protein n=1 Tax=Vibrio cholerae TaxID=666 RepID=UPI001F2FCA10
MTLFDNIEETETKLLGSHNPEVTCGYLIPDVQKTSPLLEIQRQQSQTTQKTETPTPSQEIKIPVFEN